MDFDILYLQKPWLITLPSLVATKKIRGKKVIIDFNIDSRWQKNWFNKKMTAFGEQIMPRYADIITTHNSYLQHFFRVVVYEKDFLCASRCGYDPV